MSRAHLWLLGVLVSTVSVAFGQDKGVEKFEKKVEKQIEERAEKKKPNAADEAVPLPANMFIMVEFIEVEMMDYSKWLMKNPMSSDSTPLRHEVADWIDAGAAKIAETLVVTARSGQRAKVEAISEFKYPTEFDPPEGAVDRLGGDQEFVEVIPPNPTAFETRNVGATLEVDPVLGNDGITVDLNLAPEIVMLGDPIENVTEINETRMRSAMPNFLTSKVTTQVTVRSGDYGFLGTSRLGKTQLEEAEDPILLIFVRCDVSGGDD